MSAIFCACSPLMICGISALPPLLLSYRSVKPTGSTQQMETCPAVRGKICVQKGGTTKSSPSRTSISVLSRVTGFGTLRQ